MKKAMAVLLQFLLFLVVFAVGSFVWHPFHVQTIFAPADRRAFQWDGVLLMLLTFALPASPPSQSKQLKPCALF